MVLKSALFSSEIRQGETLFYLPSSFKAKDEEVLADVSLVQNNKWERDLASSSFFAFLL